MNAKISEKVKVDCEAIAATTGASSSLNYSMENYERAMLAVCLNSTGFTTATIDLMESSAATVAGTSACGSKAGIVIGAQGGTGITTAGGVRIATLTMTTVSTGNTPSLRIGIGDTLRTMTYSTTTTLNKSTAWAGSTLLYWGSTVGCTADTGLQLALDSLKAALNDTAGFGGACIISTDATNTIKLALKDTAAGPLSIVGDTGITITVQEAVGAFDIRSADLDSTANKAYVSAKASTAAVACARGVTVVRAPGRYMPPDFKGYVST